MRGAVASGSHYSARIAAEILRRGGSAADAAIAGVAASFAGECVLNNPGAGSIATIREPDGRVITLDGFAAMPGLGADGVLDRDRLDFRLKTLEWGGTRPSFHVGRGAVAVPGTIAALAALHERYGTMPWSELLQPTTRIAREGIELSPSLADICRVLEPINTDTPELRAIFGEPGRYYTDPLLRLTALGDFLERLGEEGAASAYTGNIARAIVRDQQERGGMITTRDLAEYCVLEGAPLRLPVGEWNVFTPPPPSLGGTMVIAMLALWFDAAVHPPLHSAPWVHRWATIIEAVNGAREIVAELSSRHAGDSAALCAAVRRELAPIIREHLDSRRPLPPGTTRRVPGNTTHLTTADQTGLAIAITSSPGESAGFLVPGIGMAMNNMLGEEDVVHGGHHPPPGARLTTMMAPAISVRGDGTFLIYGSGGTTRIRTAISQFTAAAIEAGLPLESAVEAWRCHYEHGELQVEQPGPPEVLQALEEMGYGIRHWARRANYFGGVHAIGRTATGAFMAKGDPRRDGCAVVVE